MTLRTLLHHLRGDATAPDPSADGAPAVGATASPATRALAAEVRYELVPLKSVEAAIDALPPGSPVSVTCSPTKGVDTTLELTARLIDLGLDAVPHLSARMVEGPTHVDRIAVWLSEHGCHEVFVIAGDAAAPHGPYHDALAFLRELFERETPLQRVGVPAYPDGHPLIDAGALAEALRDKQALIADAGLRGSITTQMCFDASRIRSWIVDARADGLTMPIDLGVPGVVDRARLMSMGVRLGVGASLRYVRKNRAVLKLVGPGGYDPTELVAELAEDAESLGIQGLHSFTFNSVAETAAWQSALLDAHD